MLNPSFPRERLPRRVGQGCASSGLRTALWDSRSKSDQNVRKRRPERFEKCYQKVRFATKAFQKRRPKCFKNATKKSVLRPKRFKKGDQNVSKMRPKSAFCDQSVSKKATRTFQKCYQKVRFATKAFRISDPKGYFCNQNV